MSRSGGDDPWSAFWVQQDSARTRGCLPNAAGSIDEAQESWWREFAATLPRKGHVLDLGTGNGVVLSKLHSARPDLRLMGIDRATSLPPGPKSAQLRPGVAIEDLPFGNGSFDAVVSQFGYEYSDTRRGAPEIARVLRPGGRLGMILHQRGGPVLVHNLARRDAIRWVAEDRKMLEQAIRFAAARQMLDLPMPPHFLRLFREARALPASQSVAAEIVQAVLQVLEQGRGAPAAEVIERLRTIKAMATDELSRVSALEQAARDEREIEALADELRTVGFRVLQPGSLSAGPGAPPFAWLISGHR